MTTIRLSTHAPAVNSARRYWTHALFIACCWGMVSAMPASAVDVITVEEDWELTIQDPDANSAGPQIACVLAPLGNVDGPHAVFEINNRTQPEFTPGGMQLQSWHGEELLDFGNFPNSSLLNHPSETIRWTQRMRVGDSRITLEITDGTSTTWGTFGGQGYLKLSVESPAGNLNNYNPAVSVKQSGIGYAANRVSHLILKEVRLVTSDGDVLTDSTDRVVHGAE